MVEGAMHQTFNLSKINHHAVLVQFLGLAVNRDGPIVSVQLAALAGIGKLQVVAGRDNQPLTYIIHNVKVFAKIQINS